MDINPYSQSKSHVSVQVMTLDNPDNSDQREKIKANLDKYCENNLDMHVFWGTCSEFMSELRRRWEIYSHGK
jgi:hypothetical protein